MKNINWSLVLLLPVVVRPAGSLGQDNRSTPGIKDVTVAMKKATTFYRTRLSFGGGYASRWSQDLKDVYGEKRPGAPTHIMIQPPGTTTVGLAMLKAYQATGDPLFLEGAKEAADALMWCQLASGGWGGGYDIAARQARSLHYRRDVDAGDTDPAGRIAWSTLDDNKTQSALHFLLELAHTRARSTDADLRHAVSFGLDGLLAAQSPNGGWPQQYNGPHKGEAPKLRATVPSDWPRVFPDVDYREYYTLNDGVFLHTMRLLLRAWELEQDDRFLKSARRSGDFLLRTQLPEPHPIWAQQYNLQMEPAWARKFEPPAACSRESLGAMEALYELSLATGDNRYREALAPAMKWFERSRLKGDKPRWARFYELSTNRPIYCEAETYALTYESSNLPTHYDYILEDEFADRLRSFQQRLAGNAETAANLEDVRRVLSTQTKTGVWVNDDGLIDAGLFVRNMNLMCRYINALKGS